MTNAEAIEYIKKNCYGEWCEDDWREAMDMAIEALKCSETPKSSERTSETAQPDHIADSDKKVCVDTISRQAAIDAALEDVSDKRTHEFNAGAIRAVNRIKSLPSAQPATSCSEIPNGSDDTISRQAAIDAVIDEFKRSPTPAIRAKLRLEALPPAAPSTAHTTETTAETTAPSTDDWIPVEKRLPAVPWCRCLITRDDGRGRATVEEALFSFGRWYDNERLEDGRNRKFDISTSVIAWAPFPAPYRGGDT